MQIHPERLNAPLNWRNPKRIFVNSMSDLFHESVPDIFIYDVFWRMLLAKHHTFQVLTKRPERMKKIIAHGLPPHIWLGVSIEDQATADERIPLLLQIPAPVRFISAEPLLAHVDLRFIQPRDPPVEIDALNGTHGVLRPHGGKSSRLDWVICGGESGAHARPFNLYWARALRDQCKAVGIPFFMKQVGSNPYSVRFGPGAMTGGRYKFKDWKGGDMSEWPEDLRVREFPK